MMPDRFTHRDVLLLLVLLSAALAIRLDLLLSSGFVIDADEAIVGLMAKHILEGGPLPVFYYGQDYMGSFEPLVVTLAFHMLGISSVALKIVPLIFSLCLVIVCFLLGRSIGGRVAGAAAGLFCALPPAPLVDWSSKARGGFIEVVLIGALALLITVYWLRRSSFARTFLIGTLLGFGWWVNNQIIFFMIPIGFVMLCGIASDSEAHFLQKIKAICLHLACGLLAWFLGGLPFWIYNIHNDFPSFALFSSSQASDVFEHAEGLVNISLPILLGSKRFWESRDNFPYSTVVYSALYGFLFIFVLILRLKHIAGLALLRIDKKSPIELFLLFMLVACTVFALSSFGWLTQAPRYLLPLYVGIFVVCGWAVSQIASEYSKAGAALLTAIMGANVLSFYLHGRAIPGEPFVYKEERVAKDHKPLLSWLEKNNINLIRTNYWIGYRLAFESREQVRFIMFQEPHTVRIPQYELQLDVVEYDKVPLVLVPSQAKLIERALRRLGFTFEIVEVGGYQIIYRINPLHMPIGRIPSSQLSVTATHANERALNAVDGDINSRWGSGSAQNPSMRFEVHFREPQPVSQLIYFLGKWYHDFPRGLRIEVEDEFHKLETIIETSPSSSVSYYIEGNSEFSLYFAPRKARRIILSQTGSDAKMDWSIAELELFTGDMN